MYLALVVSLFPLGEGRVRGKIRIAIPCILILSPMRRGRVRAKTEGNDKEFFFA